MMQEIILVPYRIVSVSIHNGRCFKLKVTTTRNSHKFEQNVSLDLLLKRNTVLLCFIRYFIAKKIYCESSEVFFTNFLIMFRIFILFSFFISRGLAQGNVHFRLMNLRNLKLIFFLNFKILQIHLKSIKMSSLMLNRLQIRFNC